MAKSKNDIISDIEQHVGKEGSSYSKWYIGITENLENRLHGDHKVPNEKHWFITRNAGTDEKAREIEKYFLDKGMDGGTGGGDNDATYVYAYKKTSITEP